MKTFLILTCAFLFGVVLSVPVGVVILHLGNRLDQIASAHTQPEVIDYTCSDTYEAGYMDGMNFRLLEETTNDE